MAVTAILDCDCQTGGNDNFGGGFKTTASGTDYSQSTTAHVVIDDVTITGIIHSTTTQLNLTGYTVQNPQDVGNLVQILTGGTAGWYEITTADTVNNRWTVDRSLGVAGTHTTGNMGGCLATPGQMSKLANQSAGGGVRQYLKNGTYTITSTTKSVANGCVIVTGFDSTTGRIGCFIGYNGTHGDNGTKPIIKAGGALGACSLVTAQNGVGFFGANVDNIEVDGSSRASVLGIDLNQGTGTTFGRVLRSYVHHCTTGINIGAGFGSALYCEVTACSTAGISNGSDGAEIVGCYIHGNTAVGINLGNTKADISFCIIASNSGATTDGILSSSTALRVLNCSIYGNGRDGIRITTSAAQNTISIQNCIVTNHTAVGAVGINCTTSAFWGARVWTNAVYNNTTNVSTNFFAMFVEGTVTLSGDPFNNAAGGDFSLNNTASAGALCRNAGTLGTFPGGLSRGYLDIGAVQVGSTGGTGATAMLLGGLITAGATTEIYE